MCFVCVLKPTRGSLILILISMDIDAWLNAGLRVGAVSQAAASGKQHNGEHKPSVSSRPASSHESSVPPDDDKSESDVVTQVLKSVAARTTTPRATGKWMNHSVAALLPPRNFVTHPHGCGWRYQQWSDSITSPLDGVFSSRGTWLRRLRVASICSGATPDAKAP